LKKNDPPFTRDRMVSGMDYLYAGILKWCAISALLLNIRFCEIVGK
jgi:hypothetical protein